MHFAVVGGQYGDTPLACTVGLLQWGATRRGDASVAMQAQPGDMVTMVNPPPPTHTRVWLGKASLRPLYGTECCKNGET